MINKLKYWGQIFLLPIYWFSFLVPRNAKIWLFGSTFGKRFADNPKYLYLYLNQKKKQEIRGIWISKEKEIVKRLKETGLESYYQYSFLGIFYCLIARVYIFDNYSKDISFWLSGGSIKVNLWHGIPLKKIQADNKFDRIRHPKNSWEKFSYALRRLSDEKPSHYVLTTSNFLVPIFSSAFQTKHVLTCGYPRTDILVSDEIQNVTTRVEEKEYNMIKKKKYKKLILYMPTFRDSEELFFKVMNLEHLKLFMEEKEYLFCVKLHPKSKLKKEFKKIQKKSENIVVLEAADDPYIFLKLADLLITDYSSIYFDYLCLDRPIIFFDYDREEYLRNSRELYFEYEEFTPGVKAKTMEQLFAAMNGIKDKKLEDEMKKKRAAIFEKVFDKTIGNASERLYQKIRKIIY